MPLLTLFSFSCQVSAELPVDLDEADEEKKRGSPLVLYVFGRGYVQCSASPISLCIIDHASESH
jgi:hypothetical protein